MFPLRSGFLQKATLKSSGSARGLLKNQVFSAHTSANMAEGAFCNTKNAPNSFF
jgi:hypothetical protein